MEAPVIICGSEVSVRFTGRSEINHSQQRSEEKPNKVILITFDNGKQKIKKQFVEDIFGAFGQIEEMLNFKRKYHMVLLQYKDISSAIQAKKELD